MNDIWNDLTQRADAVKARPIIGLFDADAARFDTFSAQHDGLLLDFSKTNIDAQTLSALQALATETGVAAQRDAMFSGQDSAQDTASRLDSLLHRLYADEQGLTSALAAIEELS